MFQFIVVTTDAVDDAVMFLDGMFFQYLKKTAVAVPLVEDPRTSQLVSEV